MDYLLNNFLANSPISAVEISKGQSQGQGQGQQPPGFRRSVTTMSLNSPIPAVMLSKLPSPNNNNNNNRQNNYKRQRSKKHSSEDKFSSPTSDTDQTSITSSVSSMASDSTLKSYPRYIKNNKKHSSSHGHNILLLDLGKNDTLTYYRRQRRTGVHFSQNDDIFASASNA
jgi:hypothetical protein